MHYKSPYATELRNTSEVGTGANLAAKMREMGVSKMRLSEMSDVNYNTICRMLRGDRIGYLDTWVRVCEALGIELQELL